MAAAETTISSETAHVSLPDGRFVTIRQLTPKDAKALDAAVAGADPYDLRKRFMGMPPPVSTLVRRLRHTDGFHDLALGAFTDDGQLVAVAQFDRADGEPTAELAIEVATDWQHAGLGAEMLRQLEAAARSRGIHALTATYFADNLPIRRLLHDTGQVVSSGLASGEGYAELDIDRHESASLT